MIPEKFWMVLRSDGTNTSVRHATFAEAAKEAQRLAEKNNIGFYVLEAIGIVGPLVPQMIYQELHNKPQEF